VRSVHRSVAALGAVALVLLGCGPQGLTPATKLTVGLGYQPSVQFAQFYRAQQQGYYAEAGLDVTFQNEADPNLVTLVGQGAVDIGIADGTSVIPAVGQGIPIKYAATIYARFPNVVMTPAASGLATAASLRGHTLGIPGRYGSSWVMLQALLASAGMTTDDIVIREYPEYGQATAMQQGQVDSATGFRNNEPVQQAKPAALKAFVAATLRAMDEISSQPELGVDDAIAAVPDLGSDRAGQLAVLQATIEMWSSPYTQASGTGSIDPTAWGASLEFMRGLPDSNIPADLTVDDLITQELLP
jgi:NitT/TauT family transport system substrate-binding protein